MKNRFILVTLIVMVAFLVGCTKKASEQSNQEMTLEERKQASLAEATQKAQETIPEGLVEPKSEPDYYVYWYNPEEDKEDTCDGRYFVHSQPRYTDSKENLLEQAIGALFSGELTPEEQARGFVGIPFSEMDFKIKSISLNDEGVLYIDFEDNGVLDNMDLCGGGTFVTTVHHTAQQFEEVKRVLFDRAFDIPIR